MSAVTVADCRIKPGESTLQSLKGQIIVIKIGGSAIKERLSLESLLNDVSQLCKTGARVAIVHGGGPAINRELDKTKKEFQFIEGLRVTDQEVLGIVKTVVDGINAEIVDYLQSIAVPAVAMNSHCASAVSVHKKWIMAPSGARLDLGYVGEAESVDCSALPGIWADNAVPVFVPLGKDDAGQLYNVNADNVAMALAVSLGANKLVYVTDVPGIMLDQSVVAEVHADEISLFIDSGIVHGGMIPKVRNCAAGIRKGVGEILILDAAKPGALLSSIENPGSVGSRIVA